MSNIALSTDQIDNLLKAHKKFKGAFPCDQIPKFMENEYSVILNCDPISLPGSHWTALVVKGNTGFYFDSFGRFYDNFSFPEVYRENLSKICLNKKMRFQNKVLQGFHSNTCGEFCVYFIKQMDKNVPFSNIFRDFTENLNFNDKKIINLYKRD